MAHRSNQAVASQEQPAPQPEDTQPARRLLIGWMTALAALALSTAGVMGAIWLLRVPIASFFIGAALSERGAEADFDIVNLDLDHIDLADVRFGSETAPDATIARVEAQWRWEGLTPRLDAVSLQQPRLRLRVDPAGRLSAGTLDQLRASAPGRRRASIPAIHLEIIDGEAAIEAPFGPLAAVFSGAGRIGENFQAVAHIAETSSANGLHALANGRADLVVASRDDTLAGRLTVVASSLRWDAATADDAQLRITARAPLDLSRYEFEAAWRVASLRGGDDYARQLSGALGGEALTQENGLGPRVWQGQARVNAAAARVSDNALQSVRFDARLEGDDARGRARWTLAGDDFSGLAMLAPRASASGELRFDMDGAGANGGAQVTLSRARLDDGAQDTLRSAFPDLANAPISPTFASAERALDRAADRFDLVVPLGLSIDGAATRIRIAAPAEARAASGTVLRLAPLRNDAPALVMQWPGAALHGALAAELSGGGAPHATLFLDTVDWSPNAPLEADGTLSLTDWRAENASIATDELGIGIFINPQGAGRIELRGPARITGPVGAGEVRDMVATLDVAVTWNPGWRVEPNGCVPIALGGLDAAGLSFAGGAFSLCPLNGALIAADAARNLSGGFSIRDLALDGRMAGPSAQPARLMASTLTGQFRGVTGNMTLIMEASAPRLRIEMANARTLSLALQRATANARVGDNTWSIEGLFESGTLADPALPGTVTTIAGRWTAHPQEGGDPILEVQSAEALITAHQPESSEERVLFNPLRLAEASAVVRNGEINAHGNVVLQETRRQLAAFTAVHDIDEGAGATRISAANVIFDAELQPYQISERARGMVENVRGPAALLADVAWTRDGVTATGTISTPGLSFSTATMPVVQDVRGSVYFDDLFNLTTPPGQQATIGLLNPGLAARNGDVRFQLLADQRVTIERAVFDFAGGVLEMAPTTVRLGEDETSIRLSLRDVEASDLIANLNVPDLAATGRVEGDFPLRLTRLSAFVEGGVLRSSGDGGIISYTGSAGDDMSGAANIAFQALRRFRYDDLELRLDGDLNGEVISSIQFTGQNSGRPVDLGEITDLPGMGRVSVRGVPFAFNIQLTAPFRSLARTAASFTDPALIIGNAQVEEAEDEPPVETAPEPLDLPAPGTR